MRSPKYFQDEEMPTGDGGAVMTRKLHYVWSTYNATRSCTKFTAHRAVPFLPDSAPHSILRRYGWFAERLNWPLSLSVGAARSFVVVTCMYICICDRACAGTLRFAGPLDDLSGSFF